MKAKNKKKKMNTYLKYGLLMLACVLIGMFVGMLLEKAEDGLGAFGSIAENMANVIKIHALEIVKALFLFEILAGEISFGRLKKLWNALETADDETGDRIDYETEKAGAIGTAMLGVLTLLTTIVATNVMSKQYFTTLELAALLKVLGSLVIFILAYIYSGYWGVRLIKLEQKMDPTKKGDPISVKFQMEYVESCDEAEKELIYQSAFHSFTMMSQCYGVAMAAAMLLHMIWNTGITVVIFVGILQILNNLFYLKYAVQKKGKKLNG